MDRRAWERANVWGVVAALAWIGCAGPPPASTVELARPAPRATKKLEVEGAGAVASPPVEEPPRVSGAYVTCDLVHGQVLACAGPAEGRAVLEQADGTFRGCDLSHGIVTTCGAHGGGVVAVLAGPGYLACRIAQGRVAGCYGPFDGPAVVERVAGGHAHE